MERKAQTHPTEERMTMKRCEFCGRLIPDLESHGHTTGEVLIWNHMRGELSALKARCVNEHATASRIIEWMKTDNLPQIAFTEGPDRQIAYAVEALKSDLAAVTESLGDCHEELTSTKAKLEEALKRKTCRDSGCLGGPDICAVCREWERLEAKLSAQEKVIERAIEMLETCHREELQAYRDEMAR